MTVTWFAVTAMAVPCLLCCSDSAGGAAQTRQTSGRNGPLNIVAFGEITRWDADGKDYGVMWEDPRELHRVVVRFAEPPPRTDTLHLEYWQSSWPQREIPRDTPSGSGQSGWFDVGDWFRGEWKTADAELAVEGDAYVFTFRPVNEKEFPDLKAMRATYRTTFKLRLVGEAALPKVASLEAYTDSVWKPLEVEVVWGGTATARQVWDGHLEAFNGQVEEARPISGTSQVSVDAQGAWKSAVTGVCDGVRVGIRYAEPLHYNSFDTTVVTVRAAQETFSFAPADLVKWGHIVIPDFGVLVRLAGNDIAFEATARACRESKEKDLYTRVFDKPEQTFPNAWADVPAKGRHYIPLSFEGSRQHFGLDEAGNAYGIKNWIGRLRGKDTERCLWSDERISYRFGLPSGAQVDRQTVDGCLPMVAGVWEHEGVRYTETAFAVPLAGVPQKGERILADDPLVLMVRIEMELLPGVADAVAHLRLETLDGAHTETLSVEGERVCATGKGPGRLRMLVSDAERMKAEAGAVPYEARLTAKASRETLDVAIPYITLTEPWNTDEWKHLGTLRFDAAFAAVREYWRKRIAEGAQIHTPEPMINEFYQAHVPHLLINTEREVDGSLRYMAKVGTFYYGVFANEASMMITDMDRRGYHARAAESIETWFHYQGSRPLPGDYATSDGVFYGAGGYEDATGYNQHHGWVLWCIGEHYWYTRDAAWIDHAAPYIVKACDWVTRERRKTIELAERSPLRAIERGLLPPGSLEDIGDWRCWMSNNVYAWWGMRNAAAALVAAGHPEGARLEAEAAAYKPDLTAAFGEAMRRSPVVRLRDGSWVPHMPSEVHRRGRCFGWITETLEGSIHFVRCGVLEPWARESTWIIKDFEDNRYISEQYGYDIQGDDLERHWFSRGGISQQANLLCNPIPYLFRDEISHYVRAYFNAFAVSYFPDVRMMTEHALPNIGDFRGDHYKTSDEANSTYWLRLMFIDERGDDLHLGAAIPRYWLANGQRIGIENAATYFGPMSVKIASQVSDGTITMTVDPPRRNPPKRMFARFRHPEGARMTRCEVNGAPCPSFDVAKEWVELTPSPDVIEIVAHYR